MEGKACIPNETARRGLEGYHDHTIPLTARGEVQARDAGPKIIADIGLPDCVYHSGYVRAKRTLEGMLEHLPEEVRSKIRIYWKFELRERSSGARWLMTQEEYDKHFPWAEAQYRTIGPFLFQPPGGGESIADLVCGRVHSAVDTIFRDRPGQRVWLVCHGQVMRAARVLFERTPLEALDAVMASHAPNLGLIRYVYEEGSETPTRTHLYSTYTDL